MWLSVFLRILQFINISIYEAYGKSKVQVYAWKNNQK